MCLPGLIATVWSRTMQRIAGDRTGVTALEFAIVAPVLISILLGIVDFGMFFITNVCLDDAVSAFATNIRTGQIQAPGTAATTSSGAQLDLNDAKVWICQKIPIASLSTCTSQLQLNVQPLTSYQTISTSPVSNQQFSTAGFCYYSGNAGSVVQITGYYLYALNDPLLRGTMTTVTSYMGASGNFFPLVTAQVFRTEIYTTGSNTGAGC